MALTPQDIQAVQFATVKMKTGYDMEDVDAFLDKVEAEIAGLLAENASLKEQLRVSQAQAPAAVTAPVPVVAPVSTETPSEQAVRMLDLAQKTADETVASAKKEAESIVANAQKRKLELDAQEAKFRADFQAMLEENLAKLKRPAAAVPSASTAWSNVRSAEVPGQ